MIKFYKGQELVAPNGEGYRLTRDVHGNDPIKSSDFEPFGGSKLPMPGEPLPKWLVEILVKKNKKDKIKTKD